MNLKGLTPSTVYVLCSATRGPDVQHNRLGVVLKYHITRRIRGILFTNKECQGDITRTPMTDGDLREVKIGLSRSGEEHPFLLNRFISHTYIAVYVTKDHSIWGELGGQLETLLYDYVWKGINDSLYKP